MNVVKPLAMLKIMAAMGMMSGYVGALPEIKIQRMYNRWYNIDLAKAERKGKTYEEIQELRKAKFETLYGEEIKKLEEVR